MDSNGTKQIMAVDDDALMLDVIKIILEELNYSVRTHNNANEALSKIKSQPPDLLLLDLSMPKVNGVDVLNELKKSNLLSKIPVVLISASEEVKKVADDFNINSYIQKPFGVNELYKTVDREFKNK